MNADPRAATEEAAETGRFPDEDGELRDDSNPLEPEADATNAVEEAARINPDRTRSAG